MNKLFNNRKFKYGGAAVALTLVCVALVIVFNAIFTALAQKNNWILDMTTERIFDLSEESKRLLDGYREKDGFHIDFIFCQEADKVDENYYARIVHNLVKEFDAEFNFVDVKYVDINTHPGEVEQYKKTSNTNIAKTSLIVTNGTAFRVYAIDALYTFKENSSEVFAFNGEYKLTSAIIALADDNPIAYFTTGHGETVEGSTMAALFEEAGYEVRTIDLSKEEIDPAAMLLVVNNPQYDFMGSSATVNEIKKLDAFMDKLGNLMVFVDAKTETNRLKELNEYLKEWGIEICDDLLHDYSNSLSVDGTEIVATYATEGRGASLTTNVRSLADPPKTIVNYARSLKRLYSSSAKGDRMVTPVLTTSYDSTAVSTPFGSEEGGEAGMYDLMLLSSQIRYINNVDCYNNVLVAGTSSFTDDKYIGSGTYGNRDVIFTAMQAFGKKNVPINLNFKVFDPEGLDITTAEANRWTVILAVVLPVIVFAIGGVVYFRRKRL